MPGFFDSRFDARRDIPLDVRFDGGTASAEEAESIAYNRIVIKNIILVASSKITGGDMYRSYISNFRIKGQNIQ